MNLRITYQRTDSLIEYANNPRVNDHAVDKMAAEYDLSLIGFDQDEIDALVDEASTEDSGADDVPEAGDPTALHSVLAKVESMTCVGRSEWFEVVYHDGTTWRCYAGSNTFNDGERVSAWVYCAQVFNGS